MLVETIREKTTGYYGDNYHLIGENATLVDMRDMISRDNVIVNGLAILAVGLVVALVFRSIAIPLILLLTIEAAIWLNLAIPYLQGKELNFIGYLVISTVQLGATVDYGILLTQYYLDHRKTLLPREAAMQSVADRALWFAGTDPGRSQLHPDGCLTIAVVKEWASSWGAEL